MRHSILSVLAVTFFSFWGTHCLAQEADWKRVADIVEADARDDPDAPVAGNPEGDVTLLVFTDYRCGPCKRFEPTLSELINDDRNFRIVFKETPILGKNSVLATKAALAVHHIDKSKYFAYRTALMQQRGGFTPEFLGKTAVDMGIDLQTFRETMENPDIAKAIEYNKNLATALGFHATPTVVINSRVLKGGASFAYLRSSIAYARTYLSTIYFAQGKIQDVLNMYNNNLSLFDERDPKMAAISYNNRCYAYMLLGDNQKALEDCNKSLTLDTIPQAVQKQQQLLAKLNAGAGPR